MAKISDSAAKAKSVPIDDVFGMWTNRKGLDEDWLANGRSHWKSDWSNEYKPNIANPRQTPRSSSGN